MNSSKNERSSSTGNLLSGIHFSTRFTENVPSINNSSIAQWNPVFHRICGNFIIDEFMESTFPTNSVKFSFPWNSWNESFSKILVLHL